MTSIQYVFVHSVCDIIRQFEKCLNFFHYIYIYTHTPTTRMHMLLVQENSTMCLNVLNEINTQLNLELYSTTAS